jgi:DNA-binding transcriptional MerR regulator
MGATGKRKTSAAKRRSLDKLVSVTGVSRAVLVAYCETGILPEHPDELHQRANDDAFIRTVRRVEFLREQHGINLAGIRIIADLLREVEQLREELRFQRGP